MCNYIALKGQEYHTLYVITWNKLKEALNNYKEGNNKILDKNE